MMMAMIEIFLMGFVFWLATIILILGFLKVGTDD
tara:strand:+ start:2117 stop:2218 length:102 start_codon:yes stop_codon:yes gene_type:complete